MILWLHLLGAAIWVGGHLVLCFVILPLVFKTKNLAALKDFESGFEKIGLPALLVQIITGILLAHARVPDFHVWLDFSTPDTRVIFFKLLTLLLTFVLAVHARLRLWPRLTVERLPFFTLHVIFVTILALVFMTLGVSFRFAWF